MLEFGFIGKLKVLLKDAILYGGINALTKLFSLVLTPLMAYQLSSEQFGTLDFYNPLISILLTLSIAGLDSAVARFLYLNEDELHKKNVVKSAFYAQITITFILCILFLLSYTTLLKFYFREAPINANYILAVAGIFFFSSPFRFVQNLLIWRKQRKAYLKVSGLFLILNFISIIVGIFIIPDKVFGVLSGQFIAAVIVAFYSVAQLKSYFSAKFDMMLTFRMLTYSSPLLLGAFVPALIPAFERYFINAHLSIVQVAHYGIGYRLASLLLLPLQSLNTAIGPFVLSIYKHPNSQHILNTLASIVLVIGILLIVGLVLGAKLILPFLAPDEYAAGLVVVGPLGIYFLLDNVRSLVGVGIDLSMKTFWVIGIYLLTVGLLYVLMSWLTPLFGLQGVAFSLVGYGVLNMFVFTVIGNRLQSIKFNLLKIIGLALMGTLLVGALPYVDDLFWTLVWLAGCILLISVAVQFKFKQQMDQLFALRRNQGP